MDMEISRAQHEAIADNNNQLMGSDQKNQERRLVRPQSADQALKCPRCESTNTKFCYYNNYSLSQPRYFCKSCRRYWTQGGSLRNVPVGGGCRKNNKRPTSSSSSIKLQVDQALITTDTTIINPLIPNILQPPFSYNPSDLTLALNRLQTSNNFLFGSLNPNPSGTGFLDILNNGFLDSTNYPTSGLFNNQCSYNSTFDVGLSSASESTTTASVTVQGQLENNDHNGVSNVVAVNSARDYWNGAGNTYWHGLLNSSLM